MGGLFSKLKDLAKKRGCTIEIEFYEFSGCVLTLNFGLNRKYSIDIAEHILDKYDVDEFVKWVNYLIDFYMYKDKNNRNLNIISDEVNGLIDSYIHSCSTCSMCDEENCTQCDIKIFIDKLKKLNKTIYELKDKD